MSVHSEGCLLYLSKHLAFPLHHCSNLTPFSSSFLFPCTCTRSEPSAPLSSYRSARNQLMGHEDVRKQLRSNEVSQVRSKRLQTVRWKDVYCLLKGRDNKALTDCYLLRMAARLGKAPTPFIRTCHRTSSRREGEVVPPNVMPFSVAETLNSYNTPNTL